MSYLDQWYTTALGQMLLAAERDALQRHLQNVFGYHLLLTGTRNESLIAGSRVRNRIILAGKSTDEPDSPSVVESSLEDKHESSALTPGQSAVCLLGGQPERLPIMTDSLDALVLFHVLEFSDDPHQVLREAERVLVPEGHISIVGFNPVSSWGLTRLFPRIFHRRRQQTPWDGRFVGNHRVRDWLSLLDFSCEQSETVFYRFPINHAATLQRCRFLDTVLGKLMPWSGAVYIVSGRKKVSTLTPIKPRWRPRGEAVAGLVDTA